MAISNTLTDLQGQLYSAVDIVSREMVGLLPAVTINGEASRAAKGESVKVPVSSANTAGDIAPAMTAPAPSDRTVNTASISIDKARVVAFGFTGEETRGLDTGPGYQSVQVQEIAQAIRTLTNEMEADVAALYAKMSRAYGTAGTTPFASNLQDTAQILKILQDNGAPVMGGWSLVFDTTAGAKMRTLTQLSKANEAGSDSLLRQGTLLDLHGGMMRESAQIKSHTKGTMLNATTNAAGYAVGAKVLTLATAGTGVAKAGDVITIAGDTNKYLVTSVSFAGANPAAGDTITIAGPGLRVAITTAATAITVGSSYTGNMAFTRNAIQLATRLPAMPSGGDSADETMIVVDPRSGMTYEFAAYRGYHQNRYEVRVVWGVDLVKPEHTAILLG